MHIRVGDLVEVISGEDKTTRAKVTHISSGEGKIVVEGVNRVYKHMRRSQRNPQGGRLSKEMPISISNVLLVCPSCGKASRTGARYKDDGAKERFCKKCGNGTGALSRARSKYAKTDAKSKAKK